jgi:hypothetical protein
MTRCAFAVAVIDESYRNFCDIIETIFDNAEGVDMAAGGWWLL